MKFELYPASSRRSGRSGVLAPALEPEIKGDKTSWPGLLTIKWPKITKPKRIETRRVSSTSVLELETAKEILAEVFHAGPGDVEEMIQMRLEERNWIEKTEILPKEREEALWPAAF
jgi:hypothetical protein